MKAALLCSVFFSVVLTTLSQPTCDLEQQLCNNDRQQQDLKTLQDQFTAEFTAMKNEMDAAVKNELGVVKNEISKLKEQVDNILAILDGLQLGGRTGNGTIFPRSYSRLLS